jgi:RES domain-containing protein
MPILWRLTPPEFARALDGEGSRGPGGRWNSPGGRVVYTSAHLSLCVLEVYVHIAPELRDDLPQFEAVCISVPDDANRSEISLDRFANLMANVDALAACQEVGDAWLSDGRHLILQAPSALVPEEANFMLNPAHPRMREVAIVSTRRFRFDPRLATVKR